MRYTGNFWTVFDINCEFYGVVIRGETGHRSCIELSNQIDTNMISPDRKEYKGYKCQRMIFGESYVQASLLAAREVNISKSQEKGYPIKISRPGVEKCMYEWPLFQNNLIYRSCCIIKRRSKHFIWFEDESDQVRVIETVESSWAVCPLITKTIVSRTEHFNSITARERVDHDNKKSYDCSGRIFTDYYIQEVYSTLKNLISSGRHPKFKKSNYPQLVNIAKIDATNKVWTWRLRIPEADFQNSEIKISYMLIMSQEYQIHGVYRVNKEAFIQCKAKYEPTISQAKDTFLNMDLNKGYPSCERCKDVTGCSCEVNWQDPKRQKIS
ncbi:BgTH12-02517 [Blumeria graminis f. sp. triticale]|uniref:BgTH12-02517 n=1 Tax=Blumeria graminis f. sp. triticale TaxID=1689686 RepID=A0A9W4D181_BLUGR|nr:BgTH12-02517 [Blumeria graminis f. sp. triticale]